MDDLTIAATSGLRSRLQSLDLLANNLANSATSGFKRDQEFYGLYSSDDATAPLSDGPKSTLPVIEKQWTDFSQGTLQVTGDPLNVALNGTGFMVVNSPSGPLYTRNGNLTVLPSGSLGTTDGYPLTSVSGSSIQVASGQPIEIAPDGIVRQGGQPVGQIKLADFRSTNSLTKVGNTYFRNDAANNVPTSAASTVVEQGKIEGSNVPVSEAAMRLVGVMRQFEMLQKAIGISTEMDNKTIQEVARVGQ